MTKVTILIHNCVGELNLITCFILHKMGLKSGHFLPLWFWGNWISAPSQGWVIMLTNNTCSTINTADSTKQSQFWEVFSVQKDFGSQTWTLWNSIRDPVLQTDPSTVSSVWRLTYLSFPLPPDFFLAQDCLCQ